MVYSQLWVQSLCVASILLATPTTALSRRQSGSVPSVDVLNGTLTGTYSPEYEQDYFLGIPYSQPPVGDLRFRPPQPLTTAWNGTRNATEYSPQCYGYGADTWVLGNYVSEDCLTLNVVRPAGNHEGLPVGIWIHGGGLFNGGSSDPRYNLSFIVQQSTYARAPFIAVSVNYRLQAWGLLFSKEVQDQGAGNLAFRDQRLAMRWVKENIAAFGGDPNKVTIWGESAGATSVGVQMLAYGGRDDGLFRGAIMQSGAPGNSYQTAESAQPAYNNITAATNCTNATDTLDCLRRVPVNILSDVFNSTSIRAGFRSAPAVDGDIIQEQGFNAFRAGNFTKVAVLHGRNRDEGTDFAPRGINTTEQFKAAVSSNTTRQEVLAALYPDIPSEGCPETLNTPPPPSRGAQWKRIAQYINDNRMQAPRRAISRYLTQHNVTQYSYDFNVLPANADPAVGVSHFVEVSFVFANTLGVGYDTVVAKNPFRGAPEANFRVATMMSRMWISFIHDLDPNNSGVTCVNWPRFTADNQVNFMFDANRTELAYVAPDNFRVAEIDYQMRTILGASGV